MKKWIITIFLVIGLIEIVNAGNGYTNVSVNISMPINNTIVNANTTFALVANITCLATNCGAVTGMARYNTTGDIANKSIPARSKLKNGRKSGNQSLKPLFIFNGSNNGGNQLWSYEVSVGTNDYVRGVAVDSNDNIIVVGFEFNTAEDWNVTKLDSNGNQLWSVLSNLGGDDEANSVAVDSQDNIVVWGHIGNADKDFGLIKYDKDGNVLFTREDVSTGNCYGYRVAVDSQDNIIAVGYCNAAVDWNITKFNSNGVQLWSMAPNLGGASDWAYGVAIDSKDNIIVGGGGGVNNDWNVTKLNSNGIQLWSYADDGGGNDYVRGVTVDNYDNIIVVGTTGQDDGYDWNVTKLNSNGVQIWSYNVSLGSNDYARSVAVDSDNNIIVVGNALNTNHDWNVTKLKSDGTQIWSYEASLGTNDYCYDVAIDNEDNIIVVGSVGNTNPDWNVTKISGGKNPLSCGYMVQDQKCQLNWTVNASGNVGSYLVVDVNFTNQTTKDAVGNDTEDRLVRIVALTINYDMNITSPTTSAPASVTEGKTIISIFNLSEIISGTATEINSNVEVLNATVDNSQCTFNNFCNGSNNLCSSYTVEQGCTNASCTWVAPVKKQYSIFFEGMESGWQATCDSDSTPAAMDCTKIGTFNGCDNNANDYMAECSTVLEVSGSNSLIMDDWDSFAGANKLKGLWYTFNPSIACDGGPCDTINLSWSWTDNADLDTDDEYMQVLITDTTHSNIQLVNCTGGTMNVCPSSFAYVSYNLSKNLSNTDTSWTIRFGMSTTSTADEVFWDNFNITGYAMYSSCTGTPANCNTYHNESICVNAGCDWEKQTYTNGEGWRINITMPAGSGLADLFVNATYNGNTYNDTQLDAINYGAPPEDTCTYTSGDWIINCADKCKITSDVSMPNNNIHTYGTGYIDVRALIDVNNVFINYGCDLYCYNIPSCFG